jgi:hypothetical protein
MIDYDAKVRAGECERIARHIGVLLRELPECANPDELPKDCVTGMAIAYKLVQAMLTARADRLNQPLPHRKYPR